MDNYVRIKTKVNQDLGRLMVLARIIEIKADKAIGKI
jgi:hypothetical protein